MSDAFWHSEDLVEETVISDASAIDPSQPGFASLLPLLQAELKGVAPVGALAAYHDGLTAQLAQTRATLDALPLSEELRAQAAPALEMTRTMFAHMDEVLGLVAQYLETASPEALDIAAARLREIHNTLVLLASRK